MTGENPKPTLFKLVGELQWVLIGSLLLSHQIDIHARLLYRKRVHEEIVRPAEQLRSEVISCKPQVIRVSLSDCIFTNVARPFATPSSVVPFFW